MHQQKENIQILHSIYWHYEIKSLILEIGNLNHKKFDWFWYHINPSGVKELYTLYVCINIFCIV